MNRLILAAALAAGGSLASIVPADAATRNYDCSKAGNANKAQCKGKSAATAPAAKVAAASAKANAAAEKKQAAANAKAVKAAGAKPVTKSAAAAPAAAAKPGLMDRMKSMFGSKSAAPAPAARPAARRSASASNAAVEDHNPAGAIAQCKDGTYSHAKARSGACARHGGVGRWS